MSFARKSRLRIGWLLLCATLFAQGAVAASGCLMPGSMLSSVIAGSSNPHCDRSMPNPNLCLVDSADQSDNSNAQSAAAAPASADATLVLPTRLPIALPHRNLPAHVALTDPPIPIRNCCFRI